MPGAEPAAEESPGWRELESVGTVEEVSGGGVTVLSVPPVAEESPFCEGGASRGSVEELIGSVPLQAATSDRASQTKPVHQTFTGLFISIASFSEDDV